MVLDFRGAAPAEVPSGEQGVPEPRITVVEAGDTYGKFVVEPVPSGYGVTLGNPLRRMLYSSLPGSAVTWVKIDGVLHEYGTVPHIKEEVAEILLNIKGIRLRSPVDRPGKLRLEVAGEGEVCAGDIMASSDFEVVNPELHLATLDSDEARLSAELNVERGTGYEPARRGDGLPIGVLPVDAVFTPVRKVSYSVEPTRFKQRTDFERLVLEVWTDGSVGPVEAVRQAADILVENFFLFANVQRYAQEGGEGSPRSLRISPETYNLAVERLGLSSRTLNCLKRASVNKVGQILEMKRSELLQIRNFGDKSLAELYDRLRAMSLLPPELDPELQTEEGHEGGPKPQEPAAVEAETGAAQP